MNRAANKILWTVGHSTRTIEAFGELLLGFEVALLVDVRTVPRSRHNPQFNTDSLPGALGPVGIDYRHERDLGGLRKPAKSSPNSGWRNAGFRGYADHMQTDRFVAAVDVLLANIAERRCAVMCAEAVPWRCHRSLIADAMTVREVEVRHIMGPGKFTTHRLTPFARTDGLRITYPGLCETPERDGDD
jgi:uncharacterized protein (DUF488 family)